MEILNVYSILNYWNYCIFNFDKSNNSNEVEK